MSILAHYDNVINIHQSCIPIRKGCFMKELFMPLLLIVMMKFSYLDCLDSNDAFLISELEKAENLKSIDDIKVIFDDNARLYTTELMPINNKTGIVSIYDYIFSKNEYKEVKYEVESKFVKGEIYHEHGVLKTYRKGQVEIIQNFKVQFTKQASGYKIIEISFGEEEKLKKTLPTLLKPTGKYKIGKTTFFFDRDSSGNNRLLSFQVWYPTNSKSKQKESFRSIEILKSASKFLGFPFFAISYFSEIESYSIPNALPISGKKFPILIYNHGYGGYSQVYQTVFEDLASNGYIVVSVGHENESALLVKENGEIISSKPTNDFYRKRAPELTESEIGMWQSIILNSNNSSENHNAYKEMLKLTPLHNESTRLWQSDINATINKLKYINNSDIKIKGYFDFEKMGIFGHSLGGATAGQMCFGDTPFKAGINLDGFQFGDLFHNNLATPFMFVSSNREGNRFLRAHTFIENSKQDCYQIAIKGFTHDSFTDLKNVIEGDERAIELQRNLIKSFFDKFLKNSEIDLRLLEDTYEQFRIIYSNTTKTE